MDYDRFLNQTVRVVTTARQTNSNYYNTGNSLELEGLLDEESQTHVYLRDMVCTAREEDTGQDNTNGFFDIETPYGAIRKEHIVALYLVMTDEKDELEDS